MSFVKELKSPLRKKNGFHSKNSSGNNCLYSLFFMIRGKNILNKKDFEWNWKRDLSANLVTSSLKCTCYI